MENHRSCSVWTLFDDAVKVITANPDSPVEIAVKTVCVCVWFIFYGNCTFNEACLQFML